ncbi:uncharacterized protein METZ01_LOCUS489798, partial [marine metagenome]
KMMVAERKLPQPLTLDKQYKYMNNMQNVITKLDNIKAGTDFASPQQINMMENFVKMSENVLSGQQSLNMSDHDTFGKMGFGLSNGMDVVNGGRIGVGGFGGGQRRYSAGTGRPAPLQNPLKAVEVIEGSFGDNPLPKELKDATEAVKNNTATPRQMQIVQHAHKKALMTPGVKPREENTLFNRLVREPINKAFQPGGSLSSGNNLYDSFKDLTNLRSYVDAFRSGEDKKVTGGQEVEA